MFFLVAYDVSDPKRLREVAKTMEDYGTRVQKSVFECRLSKPRLEQMLLEVKLRMHRKEDRLHVYQLCQDCTRRFSRHGGARLSSDPEVWIC